MRIPTEKQAVMKRASGQTEYGFQRKFVNKIKTMYSRGIGNRPIWTYGVSSNIGQPDVTILYRGKVYAFELKRTKRTAYTPRKGYKLQLQNLLEYRGQGANIAIVHPDNYEAVLSAINTNNWEIFYDEVLDICKSIFDAPLAKAGGWH